jgi:hypothetical protein
MDGWRVTCNLMRVVKFGGVKVTLFKPSAKVGSAAPPDIGSWYQYLLTEEKGKKIYLKLFYQ